MIRLSQTVQNQHKCAATYQLLMAAMQYLPQILLPDPTWPPSSGHTLWIQRLQQRAL